MKLPAGIVLATALAVGVGVYSWKACHRPNAYEIHHGGRELVWLKEEFHLPPQTFEKISTLHRDYTAECEMMCAAIHRNDAEVRRLIATNREMNDEIESALRRSNETIRECQRRMLAHFYAVAREMPEAEARRYLAMMTPMLEHPAMPASVSAR